MRESQTEYDNIRSTYFLLVSSYNIITFFYPYFLLHPPIIFVPPGVQSYIILRKSADTIKFDVLRHAMYYCKAARPNIESSTKGQGIEPKTETLNLTCRSMPGTTIIKAKTTDETDSATYVDWYKSVYQKTTTPQEG